MYNPAAMAATAAAAQQQVAMGQHQQTMMAGMVGPPPQTVVATQNPPPYNYQINYPVTAPLAPAADGAPTQPPPVQENTYSEEPSTKKEEAKAGDSNATKGDYNRFY